MHVCSIIFLLFSSNNPDISQSTLGCNVPNPAQQHLLAHPGPTQSTTATTSSMVGNAMEIRGGGEDENDQPINHQHLGEHILTIEGIKFFCNGAIL